MNLNGQPVKHKVFGSGVITAAHADMVTICFSAGEKKFVYPDAFQQHLQVKDEEIRQSIAGEIAAKEAERQRQRQRELAEQERKKRLFNFTVTANSHAVFAVAPEQAEEVCRTFTVSVGCYMSGYTKGRPRTADRMKPNSVCLLTERPAGRPEQERRIIGICMVKEDFFGDSITDGRIEGHPVYRLLVPAEQTLLLWEYFGSDSTPRWGNIAFKYCSGNMTNQILADITELLADTEQSEAARSFYKYFCKMNRLPSLLENSALQPLL